ncbi:hypothetical protein FBU30_010747 [Linnemannia zychae]|nr:hypothetical protein FBU30_010747 [Linnemannia zychae]
MQEIKNGEATAKMALLDRIRSWVIEHKEFGVLELLDDEENKKVERESEVLGKSKSMMECVVQLEREGLLKCIDRPSMRFRVVENSIVKQDPYGGDIIVLEDDD